MTALRRDPEHTLMLTRPIVAAPTPVSCLAETSGLPKATPRMRWSRFPCVATSPSARAWLYGRTLDGCGEKTLDGYARGLERYLVFCLQQGIVPEDATKEHLASYVQCLAPTTCLQTSRQCQPVPSTKLGASCPAMGQMSLSYVPACAAGEESEGQLAPIMAYSTRRLCLTAVRLYYDYLVSELIRRDNPLRCRGISLRCWLRSHALGKLDAGSEGLTCRCGHPRTHVRWCPPDEQWETLLQVVHAESRRNQVMFVLAVEARLQCRELSRLTIGDLDLTQRFLTVERGAPRAPTVPGPSYVRTSYGARMDWTKTEGEQIRVIIPLSAQTTELCAHYVSELHHESNGCRLSEPLFRSESWRNRGQPVSTTTWSKVILRLAKRSKIDALSLPALHHLCQERRLTLWKLGMGGRLEDVWAN
jgi:integrase/recombinase XerD